MDYFRNKDDTINFRQTSGIAELRIIRVGILDTDWGSPSPWQYGGCFTLGGGMHRRRHHKELAGARAPPKFLTAGARGHNRIYGAPIKKIKRLMKKPNIQQRKLRVIPWQQTHCHSSIALSTVFYVGADSSQTPLQFVDILYRSLVNTILDQPLYFVVDWIQVWCTRVDGRKYLNTFSKLLK